MLGIGLMLFCLRGLTLRREWKTGALSFAFWTINTGLALMVLLSVLPVGLLRTWASVEHEMWYARSAEFMQTDLIGSASSATRSSPPGWSRSAGSSSGFGLAGRPGPSPTPSRGHTQNRPRHSPPADSDLSRR